MCDRVPTMLDLMLNVATAAMKFLADDEKWIGQEINPDAVSYQALCSAAERFEKSIRP